MKKKRALTLCMLVLTLTMVLCPAALAVELGSAAVSAQVCYPHFNQPQRGRHRTEKDL